MTNGNTGSEWVVIGALAGAAMGGPGGALLGGLLGAALTTVKCQYCNGQMEQIEEPYSKKRMWRCKNCGRYR